MNAEPEDDDLLLALGLLGAEHQPDVEAIRRRAYRGIRRPAPSRPRSPRAGQLAAAAVLLAVGVPAAAAAAGMRLGPGPAVVVASPGATDLSALGQSRGGARTARPGLSGPPTAGSRPARPQTGGPQTGGPQTGGPQTGGQQTGGPQTVRPPSQLGGLTGATGTPRPPSTSVPATSQAPDPAAGIAVVAAPPPAVTLGVPALLDWVAVGARTDLQQVRAKRPAAVALIVVDQSGAATSVPGPFAVSWSGGIPEQDHVRATRWLAVPGPSGVTVTVAPSGRARTLVLYCGSRDLDATVTARTAGQVTGRAALTGAPGAPVAVVVRLPAASTATQVLLAGSPTGAQPTVYLAAVTLVDGAATG